MEITRGCDGVGTMERDALFNGSFHAGRNLCHHGVAVEREVRNIYDYGGQLIAGSVMHGSSLHEGFEKNGWKAVMG
jgi:hypothetical protein